MTIDPCPFCGAKFGDKSGPLDFDGQEGEKPHQIYCWGCGAQSKLFATPEEAVAAWNRRAAAAGSEGLSAPQDTKSNPSNGLVERLRARASTYGALRRSAWTAIYLDEAADEIERLQRAQQEGVLSSQRGESELSAEDDAYEIGKRDGYEEAVQRIDLLTGGDGEYRFCTDGDPDRHTPDAAAMTRRIVERQRGENRSANASRRPTLHGVDTEAEPSAVWRVCHVITGDCHLCPPSGEVRGDLCVRGCYLHAEECINTVETGNPWRKTGEVRAPFVILNGGPS